VKVIGDVGSYRGLDLGLIDNYQPHFAWLQVYEIRKRISFQKNKKVAYNPKQNLQLAQFKLQVLYAISSYIQSKYLKSTESNWLQILI
jgi:hypothetical protein